MCYKYAMGETLTIRLDETTAKALEKEAWRTNRTKGQIVREALSAHLQGTSDSALDALAKYIGTIQKPADLSTNKRHLEGFGKPRRS
jgi:predicted DNA-binding protein